MFHTEDSFNADVDAHTKLERNTIFLEMMFPEIDFGVEQTEHAVSDKYK